MSEPENMILCPCCGTSVLSGSPFCPECGTPLKDSAVKALKTDAPAFPADPNTESTESLPFPGLHFIRGICPDDAPEEEIPDGPDDKGLKMLVDFCRKTLATALGDGHDETVLYLNEETGEYQIHRYILDVGSRKERHHGFSADPAVYEAVMKRIGELGLLQYEGRLAAAMTGGETVVKFLHEEQMVRISTDNVPYEHFRDLDEIGMLLGSFIDPDKELH